MDNIHNNEYVIKLLRFSNALTWHTDTHEGITGIQTSSLVEARSRNAFVDAPVAPRTFGSVGAFAMETSQGVDALGSSATR